MSKNNLIYCLKCPFTGNVHYVGKSTSGLTRPMQHLKKSHSYKIQEWVKDIAIIGEKPVIEILEDNIDISQINDKEKYWILKYLKEGSVLFNEQYVTYSTILNSNTDKILTVGNNMSVINEISKIMKEKRRQTNLSQQEFSYKSGVGLRWLRKIEQKNNRVWLSHLEKVLYMYGLMLTVKKI